LKIDFRFFANQLLKSELLRSASVLITGTVLAQLISILLQPVLRRLFSPETFGTYSVYLSVVGIIAVAASFRYDEAIVLPRKDKESINVLFLALVFNFLINLLLLFIFVLWGKKILVFLNFPGDFPVTILYLIPLSVFLYNTYQCFNYWLIRKKKYYSVSLNKLLRRGSEGIGQISFALLKNQRGLVYSDIIGQTANVITAIIQGFKNGFSFRHISIRKVKYVMKKFSDFPKYNMIPAIMSTCSYLLPPIFINKFYSSEIAGYFDLTKLLLSVPLAFVTASFSSVLLQKVAERFNKRESLLTDLKPVLIIVLVISAVEILAMAFFGEELFKMLFGNSGTYSGRISRIMVWSFALNFIVSTFTAIFVSMRKIKVYSFYQLLYFLGILSLLFFIKLDFISFLRTYVIIEVACYSVLTVTMIYIISHYERSLNTASGKV
jgi:O-antigen/teichoic acid export membrane protein